MITVIIPVCVLLGIILCKQIPKLGGNVHAALLLAGALSLLLGGVFTPAGWLGAAVDGIDRMAWIMFLSIFGSIYAETQVRLGTMDTVMSALKAKFGKSPKALVICIILALVLAGSLLGDAIAAATVIGVLTIGTLAAMGLSPEHICCVIVMGASMGSITPPITQALALSSTLVGTDPEPVITIGYFTCAAVIILMCVYVTTVFVKKDMAITEVDANGKEIVSEKKAGQIIKENWVSLVPLCVLILIVVFRTINVPALKFDLVPEILKSINFMTVGEEKITLYAWLSQVTILKGITNGVVLSLVFVMIFSFFFKGVREDVAGTIKEGVSKVKVTVSLQMCAAFMLGCFYAGGQIEKVTQFAQNLNANVLKFGGSACMCLIGMLTGSQSTAQNVVFSFFGPALVNIGIDPTHAAVAGANLAAAGQGLPPADLTTFVVAGIVGGMLAKKVDPVKSMIYMIPMCLAFLVVGLTFLYV